ncbi:MAG: maleylpyruvate isomerase N-terminal domain-containing protein [Acidimicrobiales bacterium]
MLQSELESARRAIEALRLSHNALEARVEKMDADALGAPSYCSDWNLGQLLSHLGSGAEIALRTLERALIGLAPLDREVYPTIWDRWNALAAGDLTYELLVWDRRHVSVLEGLDDRTVQDLHVELFGLQLDVAGLVSMRLGEHAFHSFDLVAHDNESAELLGSSVEVLIDRAPTIATRLAKPGESQETKLIGVQTQAPARTMVLSLGEAVTVTEIDPLPGTAPSDNLELPAEAFLRLLYGRMDEAHTPASLTKSSGVDLDELRRIFPGP